MVKFGRKFFFDTKNSKKKRLLSYILIGVGIILFIIILALILRFINARKGKKPKNNGPQIVIRTELGTEIYKPLPDKTAYFEVLENFDVNDITVTYPDYLPLEPTYDACSEQELKNLEDIQNGKDPNEFENPYACVNYVPTGIGAYDVKVSFNGEEYVVTLTVDDMSAPTLVLKDLEIVSGDTYSITDFVESCSDNSKKDCSYEYYYKDYNSNSDYGKLTEPGTYNISIVAIDGSSNTTVPEDATLIIKEKPQVQVFTVTFNSDGGTAIDAQYINENERAQNPGSPSREGYTFSGWYNGKNKFDFNTAITSDITLTAKWSKNGTSPKTSCSNGDLKYNADKFPTVALFVSKGNCAISKSELNNTTYGSKANMVISSEFVKLKAWEKEKGVDYCIAIVGNGPQGVPNTSGKGYVGYTIQFTIVQADIDYNTGECKNLGAEVARYFLDKDGHRKFSLNTIGLPES